MKHCQSDQSANKLGLIDLKYLPSFLFEINRIKIKKIRLSTPIQLN